MSIQGSLKNLTAKRKEVYKPILDNPFTKSSEWPAIEPHVGDRVVDSLTQILSPYGSYLEMAKTKSDIPKPEEAKYIHMGFNSVVQVLEQQAAPNRARVLNRKAAVLPPDWNDVNYVFVTRADISTGILTDMFPTLTFSASKSLSQRVKLVELPRGAAFRLSEALHTKNVNFLALSGDWKNAKFLFDYVDQHVTDTSMPWLEGIFDGSVRLDSTYQRPNIKFVKTSVPVGKRGGKKERRREREWKRGEEKAEKSGGDKDKGGHAKKARLAA